MTKTFDISKLDPTIFEKAAQLVAQGHMLSTALDQLTDGRAGPYYALFDVCYEYLAVPEDTTYFEWRFWQCLHMAEFVRAEREEWKLTKDDHAFKTVGQGYDWDNDLL